MMTTIEEMIKEFTRIRSRQHAREVRRWATSMTLKVAHKCTKLLDGAARKTASAHKGHMGEMTPQAAADKGSKEWGRIRNASAVDGSDAGCEGGRSNIRHQQAGT